MKRKLSLLPAVVLGLAMATGTAFAQIPEIISYQGVSPSNPSATITVTASLYEAATGGTAVWTEVNMPTTDATGMFMVMLGATGTAPALGSLDWSKQYWLELDINGTVISPRTQLTTSPYAFEAGEALSVANGAITAASLSGNGTAPTDGQVLTYDASVAGSLKWSTVSGGGGGAIDAVVAGPGVQVTTNGGTVTVGLSNMGITGSMIADGAINTRHLAPGAVVSSQIASFAVLTQHIGPQQVTLPKINSQGANTGEAIMFDGTQLIFGNPTPGGPAGGELSGTYPNPIIRDNVIDGDNVIDESLTGADILNESIGVDDIGPDAVGTSEIINESILAEDIATGAVTTDEILNETILAEDIATGAVTTDEILNETILSEDIMDNTILPADIMPGPINTVLITNGPPVAGVEDVEWRKIYSELIEDETIRAEDIATGAVTTDEILNETILSEDIMNGQVMTVDLADAAVTNIKLALDAVESDNIVNGTIINEDLATGSVDSRVIENESIQAVDIATGAVTTDEILNNTIINEDLATGSVDSRVIQDGSVASVDILNETILAEDIATGAVTTDEILNNTIINEDLATGSVDSRAILDGSVSSTDIQNETILAEDIATGAVTTDEILNNTIINEDLATGSVDTRAILDGSVNSTDIENETIQAVDIATGAVTTDEILNNTILNEDMATGSVNSRVIENESIESADILNETIVAADIATGAVTTDEILNATILEEDIAPSGPTNPGGTDFLQTNGATVFWGPPALGSIPASAITPGAADQVLTTNSTGTLSEWAYIETPNIAPLQVTGPKIATDAITTDKILDQDVAPIDLEPSATDGQVLKTVAGTVVWANDDLSLPYSGTDPTNALWSFEVIKTGTALGAIRGVVNNAANTSAGVMGETNGSGAAVRGLATGAGMGGSFESNGAGTALVANATGTGNGLNVTTTGGTGIFVNGVNGGTAVDINANDNANPALDVFQAGNAQAIYAEANGSGIAVEGIQSGGAGSAGNFETQDVTNASSVLTATSIGPIPAGGAVVLANDNNLSGGAGVRANVAGTAGWSGVFTSAGTTNGGVHVVSNGGPAGNDAVALWLEEGAMQLSYRVGAVPIATMTPDDIVVVVPDNGAAGTTNTVLLPLTGRNGQVIWVLNGDNDAALSTGAGTIGGGAIAGGIAVTISPNRALGFVWSSLEGGWAPLSL